MDAQNKAVNDSIMAYSNVQGLEKLMVPAANEAEALEIKSIVLQFALELYDRQVRGLPVVHVDVHPSHFPILLMVRAELARANITFA